MAAYTYKHLTAEQRADIAKKATAKPAAPVVDDGLLPAWEADHYAHSLLAAQTDGDEKKLHVEAMKQIEAAIKAATR